MNMILLKGGYVPVTIGPQERLEYLETIRSAQISGDEAAPAFQDFMHRRLIASLEEHVEILCEGKEARDHAAKQAMTAEQLAALRRNQGLDR